MLGKMKSSPFCTLSHSRKISSPPITDPQVLSMREIFRLDAFGDSVEEGVDMLTLLHPCSLSLLYTAPWEKHTKILPAQAKACYKHMARIIK